MDMDHVGLPEKMAWPLYKPFVVRKLVQRGMKKTDAIKNVVDQTPIARKIMVEEMEVRPVIINRAPTLHKYNLMASYPVLVKGSTLQVSPVITPGFNADFDGDTMQVHVPVSKKAVSEAKRKMLPSKNLFASSDFDVQYLPTQEYLYGLHLASKKKSGRRSTTFATKEAAIAAYKRGEVDIGDKISIHGLR
jgi:DNA-directed RNA polymerase subunit beta'